MTNALTNALLFALIPALVLLLLAFWLWRSKEHPRMSAGVFERDGESVMGEHLRDYRRRLSVHRLVNSFHTGLETVATFAAVVTREQFADVSFWQKVIDWAKMRTKASRVVIRACQGTWEDIKFKVNWIGARLAGFHRDLYHFYDGRVSPGAQAAKLVSLIRNDKPEGRIWIDWEKNFGGGHEGLKNVIAMIEEIKQLLPDVKIGIYTGYYFWVENSNLIWNKSQYKYIADNDIPLWLAWYGDGVKIPAPWTKMYYHQWGTPAVGHEWGVESIEIDMNSNMAGDPPPVEEPEEPVTITYTGRTLTGNAYVRATPSTSGAVLATLAPNTSFTAQGQKVTGGSYEWLNIVTPFAGWIALTANIDADPVTPPPPAPASAGRFRATINAEFVNADGVVTHRKTILIDEPLDAA